MKKYDKSLLEVWEWKESIYQDVKGLSAKEYVEKARMTADKVLSENSIKLSAGSFKKAHQKVA